MSEMDIIRWFDREILQAATTLGGDSPVRDQLVFFVADILPYLFILVGAWIFWAGKTAKQRERNQEVIIIALGAVLIAVGVRYVLGLAIDRPRPFLTYPELHGVSLGVTDRPTTSFPSVHAFLLFAFAGVVYFIGHHRAWAAALLLTAVLVAAARVVGAVHYPTDVLAGAVFGLALAKLLSLQSSWVDRELK